MFRLGPLRPDRCSLLHSRCGRLPSTVLTMPSRDHSGIRSRISRQGDLDLRSCTAEMEKQIQLDVYREA